MRALFAALAPVARQGVAEGARRCNAARAGLAGCRDVAW